MTNHCADASGGCPSGGWEDAVRPCCLGRHYVTAVHYGYSSRGLKPPGYHRGTATRLMQASLFPDAELAEDQVQEVFGGGLADDLADGVDGDAEV